jgi:hypothetical protein
VRLPLPLVGGFRAARERLDRIVYGMIAERRAAAEAEVLRMDAELRERRMAEARAREESRRRAREEAER